MDCLCRWKKVQIAYKKNGDIRFSVDAGDHNVEVAFEETPIRQLAIIVSIVSPHNLLSTSDRYPVTLELNNSSPIADTDVNDPKVELW